MENYLTYLQTEAKGEEKIIALIYIWSTKGD